jgi:hypothetical protein
MKFKWKWETEDKPSFPSKTDKVLVKLEKIKQQIEELQNEIKKGEKK